LSSAELGGDAITEPIEKPAIAQPINTGQAIYDEPVQPKGSHLEPGFQRLDRHFVTVEIITGSIMAGIASAGGIIAIVITFLFVERWIWLIIVGGVGLFLLWLWAMALFWPKLDHRFTSWRLNDLGLDVRKGVFWQHRITVPRARVQHVDVSQGPLQRNFGLAELTIYTAGTQNSSVKINGLAHAVATDIRNELISTQDSTNVV